MHFSKQDDFYRASWVSGPRHNFLAIAFTDEDEIIEPKIERLPAVEECRHSALNEREILKSVLKGIKEANREFKTDFRAGYIKYIENDTPPESRYEMLAYRIIERLQAEKDF